MSGTCTIEGFAKVVAEEYGRRLRDIAKGLRESGEVFRGERCHGAAKMVRDHAADVAYIADRLAKLVSQTDTDLANAATDWDALPVISEVTR